MLEHIKFISYSVECSSELQFGKAVGMTRHCLTITSPSFYGLAELREWMDRHLVHDFLCSGIDTLFIGTHQHRQIIRFERKQDAAMVRLLLE